MTKIVIDEDKIKEYMQKMMKLLTEMLNEIIKMKNYKNDLVWEGDGCNSFVAVYDKKIKNTYIYVGKMIMFLQYLTELTGAYQQTVEEINMEFKKINIAGGEENESRG